MPIRPENQARYPKDWKQISLRIRERAGNKCENCGVENYSIRDGSKIVLTVAHLGLPAQLPFFLHVARYAVTNEIVDLVGQLVAFDSEGPEWRLMMHDRAAAELLRGPSTSRAGFVVAFPS